jgi:nudix motif 8
VTPVVGIFRGQELAIETLKPNEDEIEDVFALTIEQLLDEKHIFHREYQPKNPNAKPLTLKVFSAGPHEVWGLTAYILDRFLDEILIPLSKSTRL